MADEGAQTVLQRLHVLGRALRHRNYRLFFSGQLISLIGTWMQTTALAWLVYQMTDSALWLGLAGFASQGPIFFLAQIGGAVADQHDKHRILLLTQTASMLLALLLAGITLAGWIEIWSVLLIAAALGAVNAFDIPARQSFVVEMVSVEDLPNAIALNSSMFNLARLIGPAVAGAALAVLGEGWCFFANGVSFLAVLAGLLCMQRVPVQRTHKPEPILTRVVQGVRFVQGTAPIRTVLILIGFMSFLTTPYAVLMPIYASGILGGGPQHLGLLMSAAGLGALIGALLLASRTSLQGIAKTIAYAVIGFGSLITLFAFSRWFWLSVILLVPVGISQMMHMASSNTLLQEMVPDEFRGRVMAFYSMLFMGMAPLGALASGYLADRLGAVTTVALSGAVCLLGGLVFQRKIMPALRTQARRMIADKRALMQNELH